MSSCTFHHTVQLNETDYYQIAYHANYFVWLERARSQALGARSLSLLLAREGVQPMSTVIESMRFKKAARLDNRLVIHTFFVGSSGDSLSFYQAIMLCGANTSFSSSSSPSPDKLAWAQGVQRGDGQPAVRAFAVSPSLLADAAVTIQFTRPIASPSPAAPPSTAGLPSLAPLEVVALPSGLLAYCQSTLTTGLSPFMATKLPKPLSFPPLTLARPLRITQDLCDGSGRLALRSLFAAFDQARCACLCDAPSAASPSSPSAPSPSSSSSTSSSSSSSSPPPERTLVSFAHSFNVLFVVARVDHFRTHPTQWHKTSHLFQPTPLSPRSRHHATAEAGTHEAAEESSVEWGQQPIAAAGGLQVRTKVSHVRGSPITFFLQELWLVKGGGGGKEGGREGEGHGEERGSGRPIASAIVTIASVDADSKQLKGLRGKQITAHGVQSQ